MPLGPLATAGIGLGVDLLSSGANALFQGAQNRKNREFAQHMYDQQRADALADWSRENEYNSPAQQMERLKAAGLNPNLVYGHGAVATGGDVRSSSFPMPAQTAPQVDVKGAVKSAVGTYLDAKSREQEIDNLKVQHDLLVLEKGMKAANINKVLADTATTTWNLDFKKEIKDLSVDALKADLANTIARTKYTLDDNERKAAMQAPNLQAAMERILNMRIQRETDKTRIDLMKQQIENLKVDKSLREADLELRKNGIYPGDPAWLRILTQKWDDISSFIEDGINPYKNPGKVKGGSIDVW